jgi:Asp-tRNA(Asn)/Glu-tRNA(Gln) amidotransferase A subunit family amidase
MTGVFGFKPSGNRTSLMGSVPATSDHFINFAHFAASIGPIGRSVDDLVTFFKI